MVRVEEVPENRKDKAREMAIKAKAKKKGKVTKKKVQAVKKVKGKTTKKVLQKPPKVNVKKKAPVKKASPLKKKAVTPTPKKKKTVIKSKGPVFADFVCRLFLKNNKAKLTDQQIQKLVLKEFPSSKSARSLCNVQWYRLKLNKGKAVEFTKPTRLVKRWDENGREIPPGTKSRPGVKRKV